MRKLLIITLSALCGVSTLSAQLSIEGSRTVKIVPESSTGLNAVYVIESPAEATLVYESASSSVTWQKFGNMGGGYADDIEAVRDGSSYKVSVGSADAGYIITDGSTRLCVWLCNYAVRPYSISAVAPAESDCDRVWLNVVGDAPEMPYYTINGQRKLIDRGIKVDYTTMSYDRDSNTFIDTSASNNLASVSQRFSLSSPLCNTPFTLHPDRFASEWGLASVIVSPEFITNSVKAETFAKQTARDSDNEIKIESESLGGSAPCEITFSAATTQAAIFHRWEISGTPDFSDVYLTYDDLEFTHTFIDAGDTYVRFIANNNDGTCEYIGDTYTISIGESRLECPNAFSPNGDGVNDEWKVIYKSIVEYHCEIFNRWGKKLATLTDPSQGWDGKVGGKYVGPGVYFYVIKARGADGRDYSKSGDINVMGYKPQATSRPTE